MDRRVRRRRVDDTMVKKRRQDSSAHDNYQVLLPNLLILV
jgi:hypothetical protein